MAIEQMRFFKTASGKDEVLEAIQALPSTERAKVLAAIKHFAEEFPTVRSVVIKPLRGKLWEMKVGAIRVLYGVAFHVLLVVLVFRKKSQKTPDGELELAAKRLDGLTAELEAEKAKERKEKKS